MYVHTSNNLQIKDLKMKFLDIKISNLSWWYTETPTQLINNFEVPTSVGYRFYHITQLLFWQANNYSSIQRFILTAKDSSGVGVTVKATIFHAVQ